MIYINVANYSKKIKEHWKVNKIICKKIKQNNNNGKKQKT